MKRDWFDDWYYEETLKGGLEIRLPNTVSGAHIIRFRSVSDARVRLMAKWLLGALDDLQRKKDAVSEKILDPEE